MERLGLRDYVMEAKSLKGSSQVPITPSYVNFRNN